MSIHIGHGNKINGTIIMEGPEDLRVAELACLRSLRIEDGTIFIETKDNAKVVIDGQPVPKKCCANCKHHERVEIEDGEDSWDYYRCKLKGYGVFADKCPCEYWGAAE